MVQAKIVKTRKDLISERIDFNQQDEVITDMIIGIVCWRRKAIILHAFARVFICSLDFMADLKSHELKLFDSKEDYEKENPGWNNIPTWVFSSVNSLSGDSKVLAEYHMDADIQLIMKMSREFNRNLEPSELVHVYKKVPDKGRFEYRLIPIIEEIP